MNKVCKNILAVFIALLMIFVKGENIFAETVINKTVQKDTRPNYALYVNKALNCVTVYKINGRTGEEMPYKAMVCSTGKPGNTTPSGSFKTTDSYEWRLMVDSSWAQYAVRFNGHILFHSVPYFSKNPGDLEYEQYNLLGESVSLGCVRLCVEDAKWIYDNCKVGTKVVVYSDEKVAGPLGKPVRGKISPMSQARGWDPTDPNEDNPWVEVAKKSNKNSSKKRDS